jgi:hypothetical protein
MKGAGVIIQTLRQLVRRLAVYKMALLAYKTLL